jgi:glycosyltransferase involved in cell wall biosynthesis
VSAVVVHVARGREWRGGEQQVLLLVSALAERNLIPQQVITRRDGPLAQALAARRLPVAPVAWSGAWDPRAILALSRQLRALERGGIRPLLHAHDSHALALALLCGRHSGVPVVATRRSMTVPGALWRRPERLIAISRAVAESLRDGGVPVNRIVVVPSGIGSEHLRDVTSASPVPPDPHLVAIGALTAEKGHAILVRAMAQLPSPLARLTIAGEGPERTTLLRLAAELGLGHRVSIIPTLSDAQLAGCTLFIQPSIREALGTAVLRAMAAGVPVVGSRTGGLTELLEGGAGILTEPEDPTRMATAIQAGLTDAALRDTLVRTARRRVEEYHAARMADRVADVYASVH